MLIWGCYGLVNVIIFATVFWIRDSPEFLGGFDDLGWEGRVVWICLRAFHIQARSLSIEFFLGFSLKAIAEAAIDCGLAAISLGVYGLLIREAGSDRRIGQSERYRISLLFSACALGIANHFHFARMGTCWDCFRPDGVPFTLFHEGGMAGGEGFVWKGVVADFLVVLVLGFVVGLVWNTLALRRSRLNFS